MNPKQNLTLKIIAFVIIGIILFPPFHSLYGTNGEAFDGFSFILSPPDNPHQTAPSVDKGLLLIEMFAVLVVGGITFMIYRDLGTDK